MSFTATTVNSAYPWRPDLTNFVAEDVLPTAAIRTASTVVGRIEGDQPSARVGYVTDDNAVFVAEGDPVPEGQPTLSEAGVHTAKIAQLVWLSRE
jgi:hypothetical protein